MSITAVMDTGSTGLVIAASATSDRDRLASLGLAQLTYSSSGRMAETVGTRTVDQGKAAIRAVGYKGERVVMLKPSDHPVNAVMSQVGADLFKWLGLVVDDQAMDAATMFQRRANRGDLDHGGWNCFPSAVAGIDVLDPAESFLARGNGKDAWYGWPEDPAMKTLRLSWFTATGEPARKGVADALQREVLSFAPYLPLGQILQPTVWRDQIAGVLPGFAKFWSVGKG